MIIQKKWTHEKALIGIWHITETEDQLLSLHNDPVKWVNELHTISHSGRRCEKLAVRALLRELTGADHTIRYDENGKPYLEDRSFNISISHTTRYACIILHPDMAVAIDIEANTPRAAKIQQRFLSPSELKLTNHSPGFVVPLLLWTAKEALYKLISNPSVDFVHHLQITDIKMNQQEMKGCVKDTGTSFTLHFNIEPNFVLTYVCSNVEHKSPQNLE